MQTQTTAQRISTQRAEDLARLASQGEKKGLRFLVFLVDHRTGAHVATSASDPSRCYQVDAERGCTCKGFDTWGRCQHHSLLLAELGRLPEPAAAPVLVCPACGGRGSDPACHGHRLAGGVITCPCDRCQGVGHVAPVITEAPARLAA